MAESQQYLDEALSLAEQLYGPRDRRVAFVLAHLAVCHAKQGDASVLMDCYQRSLATLEEIYGVNHVIFANTLKLFGRASSELGDYAKQRKILKKVLTLEQSFHPAGSEPIALTMAELGRCEGRLGQLSLQRELQVSGPPPPPMDASARASHARPVSGIGAGLPDPVGLAATLPNECPCGPRQVLHRHGRTRAGSRRPAPAVQARRARARQR